MKVGSIVSCLLPSVESHIRFTDNLVDTTSESLTVAMFHILQCLNILYENYKIRMIHLFRGYRMPGSSGSSFIAIEPKTSRLIDFAKLLVIFLTF
jgi:hypothetical protein